MAYNALEHILRAIEIIDNLILNMRDENRHDPDIMVILSGFADTLELGRTRLLLSETYIRKYVIGDGND